MGYHVIDPGGMDPEPDRPSEKRAIGAGAGLENAAVNLCGAEPGEAIPLAYHYHDEQEEAFYVDSGELAVETPGGTDEVPTEQFFVVGPGSPQRAYSPADATGSLRVVAVGAPPVDDVHACEPDS